MNFFKKLFGKKNKHYECMGMCKGVSDKPMSCGMQGCEDYQKPLKECLCDDDTHGKKMNE